MSTDPLPEDGTAIAPYHLRDNHNEEQSLKIIAKLNIWL